MKSRPEVYSQRSNPAFEAALESRTAAREAGFFLPYLESGMRVLDVGCGPGSITLGLAEVVAPGHVDGFDLQPAMVDRARTLASERGVENVTFRSPTSTSSHFRLRPSTRSSPTPCSCS